MMVSMYNRKPNQTESMQGALASRVGYGLEILGYAPPSWSWQRWFFFCLFVLLSISDFTPLDSLSIDAYIFFFFLFLSPPPPFWHMMDILYKGKRYSIMTSLTLWNYYQVSLVNIYHLIQILKEEKKKRVFFFMMRTLGTYSLNDFEIYHIYHAAALAPVIVLYITPLALIYLITGSFIFWSPSSNSSSLLTPPIYKVVLALSLRRETEVWESEKEWPKPSRQRDRLYEDMENSRIWGTAVVGPRGCMSEGKEMRLWRLTAGRWWSWMTYQGVWILPCGDGQPLEEFCSPFVWVICILA